MADMTLADFYGIDQQYLRWPMLVKRSQVKQVMPNDKDYNPDADGIGYDMTIKAVHPIRKWQIAGRTVRRWGLDLISPGGKELPTLLCYKELPPLLDRLYGDNIDDWAGKTVHIYVAKTQMNQRDCNCIRATSPTGASE